MASALSFLPLDPVASKAIPNTAKTIPGTMFAQYITSVPVEVTDLAGANTKITVAMITSVTPTTTLLFILQLIYVLAIQDLTLKTLRGNPYVLFSDFLVCAHRSNRRSRLTVSDQFQLG